MYFLQKIQQKKKYWLLKRTLYGMCVCVYLSLSHTVCVYDSNYAGLVRAAAGAAVGHALFIRCSGGQCACKLSDYFTHHRQPRL